MVRVSTPDSGGRGPGRNSQNGGGAHTPGSQGGEESVTTEAILARLVKAKDLEHQLEAIATDLKAAKKVRGSKLSPNVDQKSQALRLQLCEVLSDVILNDAQLSHGQDAIGRLWKNCFYGRINELRQRIAKEKSRAKKRAGGEGGGGGGEAAKKMVGELDRQQRQFLKEAIQLYCYIVERYRKELVPLSQSQRSAGSDADEDEQERVRATVASLYRLHIHLGDLYRYSSQHKQAEDCYLGAAAIAPGTGNPFNQLAVVAQQGQDNSSAVALYYYARSLMAAREPFETSRSNLVRLFESNERWLGEHSRDDGGRSRGIVDAAGAGDGRPSKKRAAQEWRQKERAAANRQALARVVDLQWAFFRGVSLDGYAEGRIDLEDLTAKMGGLHGTLASLIGQASFGEGLLRKVVAVLAFSTLGASNHGRLMDADGFEAKREKDPLWNEGIVMTNQALAFSFLLGMCATLANDVDAVLSKKDAGKLGSIRSLSPLLLGLRFVASLYEGECPWFHGLPFFPGAGGAGNDRMEGSSIHAMCKRSHVEFWSSVATVANRIDALPAKRGAGHEGDGIADVKEYAEYHGYVPFTSFLDSAASGLRKNEKMTKYAPAEDVIEALSEKKLAGGVKGTEAETWLKLNLVLLIADNNTKDEDDEDGEFFLSKNSETNKREFIAPVLPEEEGKVPDGADNEESVSEVPVPPLDEERKNMEEDKTTVGLKVEEVAVPLKLTYSGKGMALLTPAALLAGAGDVPRNKPLADVAMASKGATKSPSVLPVDSILAPSVTEPPPNLGTATKGVDALLANSLPSKQHQEPSTKAPLPPPPGFSIQSQHQRPSLPLPFTGPSATGISLAEFTAPVPPPQTEQNISPYGLNQPAPPGMMPQAGPSSYPASSMPETMNPFAQAPLSFLSKHVVPGASSGANRSGLFTTAAQGSGINLQQHALNKGGVDQTLDFLLNSNSPVPTPGQLLGSSNAFDLLAPPAATAVHHEPDDPAESIMKFLFDPGNDAPSRSGQPLYANRGGPSTSQHHGMPQTKNPFAR